MTVSSSEIAGVLSRYLTTRPGEREGLGLLLSCLDDGADITSRATVPVHITCGAALMNDRNEVLVIRHNALDRWLLPGGHLEPGDGSLLAAAVRELGEETGVASQHVTSVLGAEDGPLDVDLHEIPANAAKGEPAHWHADFRFAFRAPDPAVCLQLAEVSDFAWRPISLLSAERLAAKLTPWTA